MLPDERHHRSRRKRATRVCWFTSGSNEIVDCSALWAKRLRHVGAATKACSFWRARPARVAVLIQEALAEVKLHARAGAIARATHAEDGAAAYIQRIAALLS